MADVGLMGIPIHDLATAGAYVAAPAQTDFALPCRLFDGYEDAFTVTVDGVALTYDPAGTTTATFSTAATGDEGVTVSINAPLAGGEEVVVRRALPIERVSQLPEAGPYDVATLNAELTRIVALIQDLDSNIENPADLALRTDLQATGGAGLVGYLDGTVADKLVEFASPLDYGAVGDGVADDKAALAAAIAAAKHVRIPKNMTIRLGSGAINLPSDTHLEVLGEIVYDGADSYVFRCLGNVSNVVVSGPGTISSNRDIAFLQLFRLEQAAGTTLDGFRMSGLRIDYTDTVHTGGDRWAVVGNSEGTRKNVILEDNVLTGRMQLCAAMVSNGTFRDSAIRRNRIHNGAANAISVSCNGALGKPNLLENVQITGNVITADGTGHTSTGIFIGIDGSAADNQCEISKVEVAGNVIDIVDSPVHTTDILIRTGVDCSTIGGNLSVQDEVTLRGNTLRGGLDVDQCALATAAATTKVTNFTAVGNVFLGGDLIFGYLADGATLTGNRSISGANVRLGAGNGRIVSSHNTWAMFTPISANNEFTWDSKKDVYLGDKTTANNRVFTLNAAAGKVQTAYLTDCTIDSNSSGGAYSAVRTTGAGTNMVHVRRLSSKTTWSLGRYERGTAGSIKDYTGGDLFLSATWDPPSLAVGTADAIKTIAASGAALGDRVEAAFSVDLKGAQLNAWVSAADTISCYISNPNGNPNGTVDIASGHVKARFYSKDA